jgi:Ca2+-transporting ATPase
MHRPPRQLDYRIFSLENLSIALLQGLGLMTIVLALYLGLPELHISKELTNTIAFSGLVIGNLLLVIVSRSKQIYFFSILRNHNIAQYWIIGITATLLSLFISVPFLRERFQFTSLSFEAIWILLASAGLALIWYETIKFLNQLRTR